MTSSLRGATLILLLLLAVQTGAAGSDEDVRQLAKMPTESIALMRADMRAHTLAIAEVSGLLAEGDFNAAAVAADAGLGFGAMGQMRGNPNAPGRHMPAPMHRMGIAMHDAANSWSEAIRSGDARRIFAGYQAVVSACASCHMAYRVR